MPKNASDNGARGLKKSGGKGREEKTKRREKEKIGRGSREGKRPLLREKEKKTS